MNKLLISLSLLFVSCLSMIYFVANMTEKEIKIVFSENHSADYSVELISYQRDFFTATAISKVHILGDQLPLLSFEITTTIDHYPYQAVLHHNIEIVDETMVKKTESYFGTTQWLTSVEKINLFSQLTGQLSIAAGNYKSESQAVTSEPIVIDYQVDLKNKKASFTLNWAGLTGRIGAMVVNLNALQLTSHATGLSTQSDYDYQLKIKTIKVLQNKHHWLLEGIALQGISQQGQQKTVNTINDLIIDAYQINTGEIQTFTDNRLKLALTGLYQPAFQLLNTGSDDNQEIEHALIELVNHGAQLSLSQLNSQTPWGEVDGKLDLILDKGASLMDILVNPYILFDYMSGNASLVLPLGLLDEPALQEPLQMGLMTGFLEKSEQTLNLQTSFQQGELMINGKVIPL
jgi:hypothetical protein